VPLRVRARQSAAKPLENRPVAILEMSDVNSKHHLTVLFSSFSCLRGNEPDQKPARRPNCPSLRTRKASRSLLIASPAFPAFSKPSSAPNAEEPQGPYGQPEGTIRPRILPNHRRPLMYDV
jgi:hypothetical protein